MRKNSGEHASGTLVGAGSGGIIAVVVTNVVVVEVEVKLEVAVVVAVVVNVFFGFSLSKVNRCCEPANRPTKT